MSRRLVAATRPPRVHLADPGAPNALAGPLRDRLLAALEGDGRRRAAFARLRGRVLVTGADGAVAGLVFDRGAVTVWDGPPPGGPEVVVTSSAIPRPALRDALRHPRLTVGLVRLLAP